MTTKQLKNIAGMSILSLFLTGCVEAAGGVKAPVGTAISENRLAGLDCGFGGYPAVTADGQKALSCDGTHSGYSDDGLKTFKNVTHNVNISPYITAYQNKFYSVKIKTADYYSSVDGVNWTKEGEIAEYKTGDNWVTLFDKTASRLGFINRTTGKRIYIHNPPEHKIQTPDNKPNRAWICKNSKFVIAYDASRYDGLSISNDNGGTWEHINIQALEKYKDKSIYIVFYNEEFYLYKINLNPNDDTDGYYVSSDGKKWVNYRPELKQMKAMLPLKTGLLIAYDKGDDTIIENIASQNVLRTIKNCSLKGLEYYPQINSVVLAGVTSPIYNGYLSVIPVDVLTGSGITNFETADNYLLAQFGNGLQLAAYSGEDCPKPFVGKTYTLTGEGADRLKIGRRF